MSTQFGFLQLSSIYFSSLPTKDSFLIYLFFSESKFSYSSTLGESFPELFRSDLGNYATVILLIPELIPEAAAAGGSG